MSRLLPRLVRRGVLLWVVPAGLAALAGLWAAADWWIALPEGLTAEYVGSQTCARCHPEQTESWTGSDHQRAMDLASPETVLGDFNGRQLEHFSVRSRMFRRGGEYFMHTDGPDGRMADFRIKYVLGYRPLQQYLVEFPDGRVQCLPIAWDTEQKRWFHLYPDEPIPSHDMLHWTRPAQNWNYMCADCHTTNLQKNYRAATNTYQTTFSEINVSCEACHGPGSLHVRLADSWSLFWDRRYGYGLVRLSQADADVLIDSCAPCHAHRRIVYPGFQPGGRFLDHYVPALLDGELYYADGQIREEVYEYGSFLQSKMYQQKVRCTDCHDPHTTRVKFPDNRLCGQCHVPSQYDTPAHHFHPDATKPGTRCVECHMPVTRYMVVDPRLDHSLRIPRPELTVALGIPNACSGCHHDAQKGETPEWATAKVRQWYGQRKGPPHFAYAFAAGRRGEPKAVEPLEAVFQRRDSPAIVRASALALLGRYAQPAARRAVRDGLKDPEPLVRLAALRGLEEEPPEGWPEDLARLFSDPVRAVRTEAARLATLRLGQGLRIGEPRAFGQALDEYLKAQQFLGDQPEAHLAMALVYENLGRSREAEQECLQALRIDPEFVRGRLFLGTFYGEHGKPAEAEAQFRRLIGELGQQLAEAEKRLATLSKPGAGGASKAEQSVRPLVDYSRHMLAEAHYCLGLLLAEDHKRLAEAAGSLAAAVQLEPERARAWYNLGLAHQKLERFKEAEQALLKAYQLAPGVGDFAKALAILYAQQEQWDQAIGFAERLVRAEPANPEFQVLLQFLRAKMAAGPQDNSAEPAEAP